MNFFLNRLKLIFKILTQYFLNRSELSKKFISINKINWKDYKTSNVNGEILLDYFETFETELCRGYFANIFAKKNNLKIVIFSNQKNILFNKSWRDIYKSLNIKKFVYIFWNIIFFKFFLNLKKKKKIKVLSNEIYKNLKDKKDIFSFEYNGILLGRELYDEYLYRFKKPTLKLEDPKLKKLIFESIMIVEYWKNYFITHKVKAISLSHLNVRFLGIVGKVASQLFSIPIYSVSPKYITKYDDVTDNPEFIKKNILKLKQDFINLSDNEKEDAINWSKNQIKRKFSGEIGVNMHYSNASAFSPIISKNVLLQNKKIHNLICTHEFHDNPHSTGGMLFDDFYEWLLFLGEKSKNEKYNWYIKNHPDTDEWTKNVVNKFLIDFPQIILLDGNTSFLQLADEGLDYVFTCHGTVGHEVPLLGIQVINADINNPHICYDFNWNPKNINEYSYLIDNLYSIKKEINKKEIYEFYYSYNKMGMMDDLIFDSYDLYKMKEKKEGKNPVDIFIDEFTEKKHNKIIRNINQII